MMNDNSPRRPSYEDARQRATTRLLLYVIAVLTVILAGELFWGSHTQNCVRIALAVRVALHCIPRQARRSNDVDAKSVLSITTHPVGGALPSCRSATRSPDRPRRRTGGADRVCAEDQDARGFFYGYPRV
jgi:hypothetical protein